MATGHQEGPGPSTSFRTDRVGIGEQVFGSYRQQPSTSFAVGLHNNMYSFYF